ncbi:MAG: PIN domain-containing protein [Actinomycetota bacterium]|nr:PIN domain-containing protein [Actinomycetota bacterium]
MAGVTLDTGALIAIERGSRRMQALLDEAAVAGEVVAVPAGALAQAWRGQPRQARLARLLRQRMVDVVALDEPTARAAGVLCGRAATSDVVDASVVICARQLRHVVVTSDAADLRRLDPSARLLEP